jgi:hypothetical protein
MFFLNASSDVNRDGGKALTIHILVAKGQEQILATNQD